MVHSNLCCRVRYLIRGIEEHPKNIKRERRQYMDGVMYSHALQCLLFLGLCFLVSELGNWLVELEPNHHVGSKKRVTMSEKKGIKEGPPIWVETLLSSEEWKQNTVNYPSTCHLKTAPMFFKSDFEWRYRMGKNLDEKEVLNVNNNIEYLMKNADVPPKVTVYVEQTTAS